MALEVLAKTLTAKTSRKIKPAWCGFYFFCLVPDR